MSDLLRWTSSKGPHVPSKVRSGLSRRVRLASHLIVLFAIGSLPLWASSLDDRDVFVQGSVAYSQKNWDGVTAALDRPWPKDFLLADYVAFYLGEAFEAKGEGKKAQATFTLLNEKYPESRWVEVLQKRQAITEPPIEKKTEAEILFEQKQYEKALPLFQAMNDKKSWSRVFSCLSRLRRTDEAVSWYEQRWQEMNNPKLLLVTLVEAGRFETLLQWLANEKWRPGLAKTEQQWWKGWAHYRLGDYFQALEEWKTLKEDRALYWRGRAAEESGDREEARRLWRETARRDKIGFYGWAALRRLFREEETLSKHLDQRWIGEEIDWRHAESPPRDKGLKKVRQLQEWGLESDARQELLRWPKSAGRKKEKEQALQLAQELGEPSVALRIAESWGRKALSGFPPKASKSHLMWKTGYPKGYAAEIEPLAKSANLDPYFVYALIRQESRFQPGVVSPAGAIGVMQLMPATAVKLAKARGQTNLDLSRLVDPPLNINLGILYLRFLTQLFPENLAYVIASYNAGEEAVARWVGGDAPADREVFIEEIPYQETRHYVKKVLQNYWNYRWFYERDLGPLYR